MDLTLVAFYGPKPAPFSELVEGMQAELRSRLGTAFSAYPLEQVHATIIGLEGLRKGADVFNSTASQAASDPHAMDLEGLLHFMRGISQLHISIGGFADSYPYPFTSRGFHPFFRSFALDGPLAVAMGWPVAGKSYPLILDSLRRACREYNVSHKYHQKAGDIDNDFFFVLGRVNRENLSEGDAEKVQNELRQLLSEREPLDFILRPEDLSVVAYVDRQLPLSSSIQFSIDEALERVNDLKLLYREVSETCQPKPG